MTYRVELLPRAHRDLDTLYHWLLEKAPSRGPEWFNGLEHAIDSLAEQPHRCPVVSRLSTSDMTVRQLL